MKRVLKGVAIAAVVLVTVAIAAVAYLVVRKPAQRVASAERIEATPERIERGRYLVNHVGICFDCHSERTPGYGLPFKQGGEGARGFVWTADLGFPGTLAASNITPDPETGLGDWTDGEILRAIREGVDRNGNALFPLMPYKHLRSLSDEDGKAIVAYLRTLRPIRYERPAKALKAPLNIVEKFEPEPLEGVVTAPDPADTVAYGRYLVTIASCGDCHTPKDERGQPIPGQEFTGGFEMHAPGFVVTSANITPHPDNWVGQVSREAFIARFKAAQSINATTAPEGVNTLMPWITYSGMTEHDLGAIYDYLRTLPPSDKKVMPFARVAH